MREKPREKNYSEDIPKGQWPIVVLDRTTNVIKSE